MAYVNGVRGIEASLAERAAAFVNGLRDNHRRYRVYRQTMNELRALSDRELNDLGIHRSAITAIAMEAAYGK
ncbi:DUF1127 domain-containing protein [Defluviimonas sp. SAOS-178_SWC]|uniref:DUF1127 domain-containing protein n=1 Tax=Defluviimonas sp. SAOS-178_SWC TaxID=3121287 RepID=UPI0032219C4C